MIHITSLQPNTQTMLAQLIQPIQIKCILHQHQHAQLAHHPHIKFIQTHSTGTEVIVNHYHPKSSIAFK